MFHSGSSALDLNISRVKSRRTFGNCRFKTFKAVRNSTMYEQSLQQILFITQLSCICSINYFCLNICAISLLLAGDVEINPGLIENYRSTVLRAQKAKNELKIFHLNSQIFRQEETSTKKSDWWLGLKQYLLLYRNFVHWNDHEKLYKPDKENFCCFIYDRKLRNENKLRRGGEVMILAPKHLSSKIQNDLNKLSKRFESL